MPLRHVTFIVSRSGRRAHFCALRMVKVCLMAAGLSASMSACSPRQTTAAAPDTLRIGVGAGPASGGELGVLTDYLFAEPLLYTDWHGRTVERLASAWRWEDEGLTLRIQLRRGVTMHDGRPVTAALVAGILPPKMKDVLGFEYVRAIEPVGEDTLLFRLSRPDAFLLDALDLTSVADNDIGTGPFKLRSHTPTVKADRNDAYYAGRPGLARVEIVPYDRQRTAWAGMLRGEVDMLQEVARESVDFLEGASQIDTISSIRPFYIPLVFNLRHPVLRKVDVRRALVESINRDEIVTQAMRGRGMVADDPIWPYNWAYTAAARHYAYSPEKANLRLDAAGLAVSPATPGHMASRARLTCLFWREGPQFERIALLLQRQMASVGIDLELEPVSVGELMRRVSRGQFDTYLMMMTSGRTFQRTYRFWHSSEPGRAEFQDTGYSGADRVLERLRVARAEADIRAGVADLRQRFYEDVPAAFLAWPQTTRAVDSRFHLAAPDDPDIFANIWEWRPASTERASR